MDACPPRVRAPETRAQIQVVTAARFWKQTIVILNTHTPRRFLMDAIVSAGNTSSAVLVPSRKRNVNHISGDGAGVGAGAGAGAGAETGAETGAGGGA
jgi:hypothetical protein